MSKMIMLSSRGRAALLLCLVAAVVVGAGAPRAQTAHARHREMVLTNVAPACPGSPVMAVAANQNTAEDIGLDVSPSTGSASLQELYSAAALAIVERAAAEQAALRIVAFGASGVGARLVFQGSFAPETDNSVYNVAAANRLRCWAQVAVDRALKARAPKGIGGSDVVGALASLIIHGRSIVRSGRPATVTLITDGCHAPASSGPNRVLTDLCGKLERGKTPREILRAHPSEFVLPSAANVSVEMKGVGVGARPAAASSVRARRLISFWTLLCRRNAHARACDIRSELP